MKKMIFSLIASLCFITCLSAVVEGERYQQTEEAVKMATYGHIDAKGLKNLIDSNVSFVLLDARGQEWHDGSTIPGAKLAFYEDFSEDLEILVPNKESLVVVYCYSFTCPLSDRLAQKLIELGYQHIMEYPAGMKEWRDIAGYPTDPIMSIN